MEGGRSTSSFLGLPSVGEIEAKQAAQNLKQTESDLLSRVKLKDELINTSVNLVNKTIETSKLLDRQDFQVKFSNIRSSIENELKIASATEYKPGVFDSIETKADTLLRGLASEKTLLGTTAFSDPELRAAVPNFLDSIKSAVHIKKLEQIKANSIYSFVNPLSTSVESFKSSEDTKQAFNVIAVSEGPAQAYTRFNNAQKTILLRSVYSGVSKEEFQKDLNESTLDSITKEHLLKEHDAFVFQSANKHKQEKNPASLYVGGDFTEMQSKNPIGAHVVSSLVGLSIPEMRTQRDLLATQEKEKGLDEETIATNYDIRTRYTNAADAVMRKNVLGYIDQNGLSLKYDYNEISLLNTTKTIQSSLQQFADFGMLDLFSENAKERIKAMTKDDIYKLAIDLKNSSNNIVTNALFRDTYATRLASNGIKATPDEFEKARSAIQAKVTETFGKIIPGMDALMEVSDFLPVTSPFDVEQNLIGANLANDKDSKIKVADYFSSLINADPSLEKTLRTLGTIQITKTNYTGVLKDTRDAKGLTIEKKDLSPLFYIKERSNWFSNDAEFIIPKTFTRNLNDNQINETLTEIMNTRLGSIETNGKPNTWKNFGTNQLLAVDFAGRPLFDSKNKPVVLSMNDLFGR